MRTQRTLRAPSLPRAQVVIWTTLTLLNCVRVSAAARPEVRIRIAERVPLVAGAPMPAQAAKEIRADAVKKTLLVVEWVDEDKAPKKGQIVVVTSVGAFADEDGAVNSVTVPVVDGSASAWLTSLSKLGGTKTAIVSAVWGKVGGRVLGTERFSIRRPDRISTALEHEEVLADGTDRPEATAVVLDKNYLTVSGVPVKFVWLVPAPDGSGQFVEHEQTGVTNYAGVATTSGFPSSVPGIACFDAYILDDTLRGGLNFHYVAADKK